MNYLRLLAVVVGVLAGVVLVHVMQQQQQQQVSIHLEGIGSVTLPATITDVVFPLWLPPTPDSSSVVGSHGDYEWVYPSILNRTQFAHKRFVANELKPCLGSELQPCCSVGSKTDGGHLSSTNGIGLEMNFMAEFQPIPRRALFSLVDVLKAWRRANPARPRAHKMKLVFWGDSITGQIFTAALCELARNEAVEWMTYNSLPNPPFHSAHETSFRESHVKLKGEKAGAEYELVYIRQWKRPRTSRVVRAFLRDADVILIGLGLHYAVERVPAQVLETSLSSLVSVLRETHNPALSNRTLLFLGDSHQHFRYGHEHEATGLYSPELNSTVQFCGPVTRFPEGHSKASSISSLVYDYFTNQSSPLHLPSSWFRWSDNKAAATLNGGLHVHFYPLFELTAPFYENKISYDPDSSKRAKDCTHIYGAPNFYESVWDALFVIVNAAAATATATTTDDLPRFPAGTQQHPNFVPFNGALAFDAIVQELANEEV